MKVCNIQTVKSYEEFVSDGKVLIVVRPHTCATCERLAPVFFANIEEVKSKVKDLKVAIVFIEDAPECAAHLGVCSPTLFLYKDGKLLLREVLDKYSAVEFQQFLLQRVPSIFSQAEQ